MKKFNFAKLSILKILIIGVIGVLTFSCMSDYEMPPPTYAEFVALHDLSSSSLFSSSSVEVSSSSSLLQSSSSVLPSSSSSSSELQPSSNSKIDLTGCVVLATQDTSGKLPFPEQEMMFGKGAAGGGAVGYGVGGSPAPGLSNFNTKGIFSADGKVNTFGTVGEIIPANRTGELILTVYPSANDQNWEEVVNRKFFGLPPSANSDNGLYGIANPASPNQVDGEVTGGFPFVKNGFTDSHNEGNVNGSMQISPTRCVSSINDDGADVNCLNFNFVTMQPFQITVTVYDKSGNSVTQYKETLTEQEFRYVTQGSNYIPSVAQPSASAECVAPTAFNYGGSNVITTNGRINIGVNIYPFLPNGEKFNNGTYTVKIEKVDLPFQGCYNNEGFSSMGVYLEANNCYYADVKYAVTQ